MIEADAPMLPMGRSAGNHPVIVIDTSGAAARQLAYVKAAVKRALHAQIPAKQSFQLVAFASSCEPRTWASSMHPPTSEAIASAEDWISSIGPVRRNNLVDGIELAFMEDCDEVWLVTSGAVDCC